MEKEEWKVSLPRKLTADETALLKSEIRPILEQQEGASEDYIGDVMDYSCSMISNSKPINYVVSELIGMELDFLPALVVKMIAEKIQLFLASVAVPAPVADGDAGAAEAAEEEYDGTVPRVVTIKSSVENALTMSGALGASREGGRKQQPNKKESGKNDGGKGRNDGKGKHQKDGRGNDRGRDNNNNRGKQNNDDRQQQDRGGRDRHGRAFDRLTEGGGRRGRDDRRGPRGGGGGDGGPRGGGRGFDDRRGGRDAGRHGRGGRGGRMSGNRRDRDEFQEESDFVPADDPRGEGGGGRRGGRGGRGRGGRDGYDPNKRQRMDEGRGGGGDYYDESQEYYQGGYDDGYYDDYNYYPPPRGGPARGGGRWGGRGFRGRGVRGSGRFGGRGRGGRGDFSPQGEWDNTQEENGGDGGETAGNDDTAEAAAVHPSPIVKASYGGGFRGRGFRGRGRGRSFGGRTLVKNMLASKTWVRKKDGEGGDDAEGGQP